jgi:hypothetical protein
VRKLSSYKVLYSRRYKKKITKNKTLCKHHHKMRYGMKDTVLYISIRCPALLPFSSNFSTEKELESWVLPSPTGTVTAKAEWPPQAAFSSRTFQDCPGC